ncbi:MAG: hypothetical protein JO100_02710 [Pseudonocardia sp.]|nr:hypothetical protein [Pseudonocardia sp.]
MNRGFEVDLSQLDSHADALDGHAELVGACARAGRSLSSDAYGVIGRFVASGVVEAESGWSAALNALAHAAERNARKVRKSVSAYRAEEVRITGLFQVRGKR